MHLSKRGRQRDCFSYELQREWVRPRHRARCPACNRNSDRQKLLEYWYHYQDLYVSSVYWYSVSYDYIYSFSLLIVYLHCGPCTCFTIILSPLYIHTLSLFLHLLDLSPLEQLGEPMANGWYMASLTLWGLYPDCSWHLNFKGVTLSSMQVKIIFFPGNFFFSFSWSRVVICDLFAIFVISY